VEAELGAEERDRPGDSGARTGRPLEVGGHAGGERGDARHQPFVLLDGLLRRRPEIGEEADRVLSGELPAVGADAAEDRLAVRKPAPPVVVRDLRERLESVDEPVRQRRDSPRAVTVGDRRNTVSGRGVHVPARQAVRASFRSGLRAGDRHGWIS
jgi:hypothetical protein